LCYQPIEREALLALLVDAKNLQAYVAYYTAVLPPHEIFTHLSTILDYFMEHGLVVAGEDGKLSSVVRR